MKWKREQKGKKRARKKIMKGILKRNVKEDKLNYSRIKKRIVPELK